MFTKTKNFYSTQLSYSTIEEKTNLDFLTTIARKYRIFQKLLTLIRLNKKTCRYYIRAKPFKIFNLKYSECQSRNKALISLTSPRQVPSDPTLQHPSLRRSPQCAVRVHRVDLERCQGSGGGPSAHSGVGGDWRRS